MGKLSISPRIRPRGLGFRSVLWISWALLVWGCSAPNAQKLSQFPNTPNLNAEVQKGETCEVRACRLGDRCLKDLFKSSKVGRSFIVFWVNLTSLSDAPIQVTRNRIWLNVNNVKIFPVDPARVAYVAKRGALAGASLAFVFWPAAIASVEGVESANKQRLQVTGTNAFPDHVAIPPGSTISGFLYFEPPSRTKPPVPNLASTGGLELTVPIEAGEKQEALAFRNIPVVNPALGKEGKTDEKKD